MTLYTQKTPEEFLQKLDEMAAFYEKIVGQPFRSENHRKGKGNNIPGALKRVGKQFKLKNVSNVRMYLKLWEMPEYAKTAIRNGVSWKQFFLALQAPEDIRELVIRKTANKEFKNANDVKAFIKGPKPSETVEKGVSMEEPKSLADQARDAFRTSGELNIAEYAKKFYGDDSERNTRRVKSVIYSITRSIEIELKKTVVNKGDRYVLEDESPVKDAKPELIQTATGFIEEEKEGKTKSKTAVVVIREIKHNGNTRYEMDAVGDFNRGMIKEALKQLMEVYI